MRALATLHRWWGVVFCLLFAMWFASGIVMHFVPFPARSERAATREVDAARAGAELIGYDQWTVAGDFDSDRPLSHLALKDGAGTEIYLSSRSGNVVLSTTRNERWANYSGSIAHWIYPTELRHHRAAWSALMWWLSLLGTIGAAFGVMIGLARLGKQPAYRGLQRWHHVMGLVFAPFLLAWIFSGFLSMDDGSLFAHSDALFRVLHRLDFESLSSRPWLRSSAIVVLCLCGLAFSLTGVVLALRRLSSNNIGNSRWTDPK
jgi:PepSY-associated TM region